MSDATGSAGSSLGYVALILGIGFALGVALTLTVQAERAKAQRASEAAQAITVAAKADAVVVAKTHTAAQAAKEARHEINSAPPLFTVRAPDAEDGLPLTCTDVNPDAVWRRFADSYNRVLDGASAAGEPDPVQADAPGPE